MKLEESSKGRNRLKRQKKGDARLERPLLFLDPDAGGYAKSGCDSGEYSDDDVQDFTPDVFVFHDILSYD